VKLSDIMGALRLEIYPEIALAIFLVVFAGVVLRLFTSRERFDEIERLPLADEPEAPAPGAVAAERPEGSR
jgi:cbb3-type cytochrome oxidase subunit 3